MRRCLFKLSARVNVIGQNGHLCCSGLWDFMCFFLLLTSFPQILHGSGALHSRGCNATPNDLTNFSILGCFRLNDSRGFTFSSFSPVMYVILFTAVKLYFCMLNSSNSNVRYQMHVYFPRAKHHLMSQYQLSRPCLNSKNTRLNFN